MGTGTYPALIISLLDANNNPTLSLSDVTVYLSSSNQSVLSVPSIVGLPAGQAFLQVSINTTSMAGISTVTAAASGLASAFVNIRTVRAYGFPTSLNLYAVPGKSLQALQGKDAVVAVQLENTRGTPTYSPSLTGIIITSSNSSLVSRPINITIPFGFSTAYTQVKVKTAGTTTFNALSAGLETGTVDLTVSPVQKTLKVTFEPPEVGAGNVSYVHVLVQVLGIPISGANVTIKVSQGVVVPNAKPTDTAGTVVAKFISAVPGPVTVVVNATSKVIGYVTSSSTLIVKAAPVPTPPSSPLAQYWIYIPIAVVAAVVALTLLVVRRTLRKRRGSPEEEEFAEDASKA
jgi:hypothetical protein